MENGKSAERRNGEGAGAEWAKVAEVEFNAERAQLAKLSKAEKEMLKVPKVKEFPAGAEERLAREGKLEGMLTYPIDEQKTGAVERGKATWSFINQIFQAETPKEFRAANLLAQSIEQAADADPEELEEIEDFRKSPAYQIKRAGFSLDQAQQRFDEGDLEAEKDVQKYLGELRDFSISGL